MVKKNMQDFTLVKSNLRGYELGYIMTQEIKQRIEQLRLNKTPDGYKKTAIGVIPQDWEVVRFKKLFSRLTRRNTELNKNVLTISAQYGLISQEEFFNKTVASENTETYFLLNKGDFAYNKSYSNGYPYGAIKSLTKYNKGIVSPLYICFSVTEENKFPEFYNQYFEAGKFNREINAYAQEGARNHGLLNIAVEDFFNSLLIKPPLAEQQKIAAILSTQDKVIELQQKRIDELKKLKKAYLSKMFPQKGSNVPELRFKRFSGNWEQRKFLDLGTVAMCKRVFKEETSEKGDIPFYKIGTFGGIPDAYISRKLFEEYKSKFSYPKVGDLLISASGTIGRTVEYSGKDEYFQDSNIVWLNHDDRLDNSFLKCLYSTVKWAGIEGSTIKRLYNDNFLKTKFKLPSPAEQQKIGAFFRKLDDAITLQSRKLDAEKLKKKSLMQLLLTGIVRVK